MKAEQVSHSIRQELGKMNPDLPQLYNVLTNMTYARCSFKEVCFLTDVLLTLSSWHHNLITGQEACNRLREALEMEI